MDALRSPLRRPLAVMLDKLVLDELDDLAALASACSEATLNDLARAELEEEAPIPLLDRPDPRF